ncbi:MAG TPA: GSCFA domain-containing protein [Thermoguttaceae bacterium]|nr:GSCFA domain-containing protein [Thermoguttaceae bacterium]
MPTLRGRLGEWDLPCFQLWQDRETEIRAQRTPLIGPTTRIATIGSCFAEEIAAAMSRLNVCGTMHPTGRVYNTRSIRQEIERVFGGWAEYRLDMPWKVQGGFVHPFKDPGKVFPTEEALQTWSDEADRRADELFRSADVVVITLGLIEAWMQPATGNVYRHIPHPDVFESLGAKFHRLSVAEMIDDLTRIRAVVREHTGAEIILTVSPIPLHATMTSLDVRIANTESKSRIRAAVSEFVEAFPDVHYFHSYEIVTTADSLNDFVKDDGRHVHRRAVDSIVCQFLSTYATDEIAAAQVASSEQRSSQPMRQDRSLAAKLASQLWRHLPLRKAS